MESAGHVFVSYRADARPFVRKLAKDLRSYGVDPWLDTERLKPGTTWREYSIVRLRVPLLCSWS